MMVFFIIAAFAGFFFCLSSIYMRKGMYWAGESFTAVAIACFTGVLTLGVAIVVTGEVRQLATISGHSLIYLVLAGVFHFVAGRLTAFWGARLIGANLSNPILNCQALVSVILGIVVLGEPLTVYLVLAALLILGGVVLIGRTGEGSMGGGKLTRATLTKGVLLIVLGSLFYGTSPLLIKMGLGDGLSAITGSFVSYVAASIIICLFLLYPQNKEKLRRISRKALGFLVLSSLILSGAQLLRYMALGGGAVSLIPLIFGSISALFVFPLSFVINRKIEIFNGLVIMGAVLTTGGVVLIFLNG